MRWSSARLAARECRIASGPGASAQTYCALAPDEPRASRLRGSRRSLRPEESSVRVRAPGPLARRPFRRVMLGSREARDGASQDVARSMRATVARSPLVCMEQGRCCWAARVQCSRVRSTRRRRRVRIAAMQRGAQLGRAEAGLMVAVPVAWAVLLLFHPTGEGDEFYPVVRDQVTAWMVVHVGTLVFVPLLASVVYLLLRGVEGVAALLSRLALAVFAALLHRMGGPDRARHRHPRRPGQRASRGRAGDGRGAGRRFHRQLAHPRL